MRNFHAEILDTVVVVCVLLITYSLLFLEIPASNREILNVALGALIAKCGTIIDFHRGSSSDKEKVNGNQG